MVLVRHVWCTRARSKCPSVVQPSVDRGYRNTNHRLYGFIMPVCHMVVATNCSRELRHLTIKAHPPGSRRTQSARSAYLHRRKHEHTDTQDIFSDQNISQARFLHRSLLLNSKPLRFGTAPITNYTRFATHLQQQY